MSTRTSHHADHDAGPLASDNGSRHLWPDGILDANDGLDDQVGVCNAGVVKVIQHRALLRVLGIGQTDATEASIGHVKDESMHLLHGLLVKHLDRTIRLQRTRALLNHPLGRSLDIVADEAVGHSDDD